MTLFFSNILVLAAMAGIFWVYFKIKLALGKKI